MTHRLSKPLWLIIPAAGIGQRLAAGKPKQYLLINGQTVLEHTIHSFAEFNLRQIIIPLAVDDPYWPRLAKQINLTNISVCAGGETRCDSVFNGLANAAKLGANASDWVLVHDAARPCVEPSLVQAMLAAIEEDNSLDGIIMAVPCRDTIKQSFNHAVIDQTLDRNNLWLAQTPQCFRFGTLQAALNQSLDTNVKVTDEASAIEACGGKVGLFAGRYDNIKITFPEDLLLAEVILRQRGQVCR